jgi:hypothetical protein
MATDQHNNPSIRGTAIRHIEELLGNLDSDVIIGTRSRLPGENHGFTNERESIIIPRELEGIMIHILHKNGELNILYGFNPKKPHKSKGEILHTERFPNVTCKELAEKLTDSYIPLIFKLLNIDYKRFEKADINKSVKIEYELVD